MMLWFRPARDTSGFFAKRAASPPVWGDGFEDDTFRQIASVRDWDELSSDEFLRLYPRLLHQTPPSRLLDHAERCVATLCFRLSASPRAGLRSIAADRLRLLASSNGSAWASAPTKAYLDGLADGEFRVLDDILASLKSGDAGAFALERAELFAFHTGIHPAYFWPEAVVTHQRLTTFGWLGVLMRGRPALMSTDVAEYLQEAISDLDGDGSLERGLGSRRLASMLARHAASRLKGRTVVSSASARYAS